MREGSSFLWSLISPLKPYIALYYISYSSRKLISHWDKLLVECVPLCPLHRTCMIWSSLLSEIQVTLNFNPCSYNKHPKYIQDLINTPNISQLFWGVLKGYFLTKPAYQLQLTVTYYCFSPLSLTSPCLLSTKILKEASWLAWLTVSLIRTPMGMPMVLFPGMG